MSHYIKKLLYLLTSKVRRPQDFFIYVFFNLRPHFLDDCNVSNIIIKKVHKLIKSI